MEFTSATGDILQAKTDAIVFFTYEHAGKHEDRYKIAFGENVTVARTRKEFEGKPKQILVEKKAVLPRYNVLVGLGLQDKVNLASIRNAAYTVTTTLKNSGASTITFEFPDDTGLDPVLCAQALTEGISLASYQFITYKTQKLDEIKSLNSVVVNSSENLQGIIRPGLDRGMTLGNVCNLVRDLQNLPSSDLFPKDFANKALRLAKQEGIKSSVLEKDKLIKLGYG